MKKRWKVFWIICGVVVCVGIILCMTGVILGARSDEIRKVLGEGVRIGHGKIQLWDDESDSRADTPDGASPARQSEAGEAYWGVTKLDVDTEAVRIEIVPSQDDAVYVQTEHISSKLKYSCEQDGDELMIRTAKGISHRKDYALLRIYVPEQGLDEVELDNGAGEIYADRLSASKISIDIGAGEAELAEFTADSLELECGAGEITGTGSVESAADVECGVGEVTLTLTGREEDYDCDVSCGIGEVRIGGHTYSGIAVDHDETSGNRNRSIQVDCGIGEVSIDFTE